MARKAFFVVRDKQTKQEVRRKDVTRYSESARDQVERDLLRTMDKDNYYLSYEERGS